MGKPNEQSTAVQPATLKASPQDGGSDTNETSNGVQVAKADAAAILTSTISMMIKAGWPLSIGVDGDRAYIVIDGATWTETAAGWMLREVAK